MHGGQIDRTCKQCQRNKAEKELACGYLPLPERSAMTYVIPEFQDITFTDNICPVYTYLENLYLYEYINIAKTMSLKELSGLGRFVIQVYTNYQALKKQ